MENMDNMELNEMREQISLLREKLRQQEIVSESAIMVAVRKGVKTLNRRGIAKILLGLFAVPFCCGTWAMLGSSIGFVICTAFMLIFSLFGTIYAHFGLGFTNVARTNLVQIGLQTAHLRKIYKLWNYYTIPVLLIWGYFYYREITNIYGGVMLTIMLIGSVIGALIGLAIGLWIHFRTLHEADEVLEHINEFQQLKE